MTGVDVVLPVRNGASTIQDALESILSQTFSEFQVFVVDDRSTDETPDILRTLSKRDPRIKVIPGEGRGIVAALNLGLAAGSAPLVARMDADDISLPDRFIRQVATFSQRPDLVLLGTRIEWFGNKHGRPGIVTGPRSCRNALALFTPFCHPSVMMRRSALKKLELIYDAKYEYSEDWELFSRLSAIGEVDNLDEVLLRYRVHSQQISATRRDVQIAAQGCIARKHQSEVLGVKSLLQEILLIARIIMTVRPANWRQIYRALRRRAVSSG